MKVHRLHKDFIGGVLMFSLGIGVTVHSATFEIGSLSQMGPGFFPLSLGLILTLVGCVMTIKARLVQDETSFQKKKTSSPQWKAWILISLGLLSFVALAKNVGLVAASFSVVFISALADRDNSWRSAALLALVMAAVSVVVFWWALKIQLPLFAWGKA